MTSEHAETIDFIHNMQKQYCDYLDGGDVDSLLSMFTTDCEFYAPSGQSTGKAAFEDLIRAAIDRHEPNSGRHVIGTGITYCANESTVYSTVPFIYVNFDENTVVMSGEYLDRWERIDNQWLLGARDVRVVNGPRAESRWAAESTHPVANT